MNRVPLLCIKPVTPVLLVYLLTSCLMCLHKLVLVVILLVLQYNMFHLSPCFRLFTCLFSRTPFGECVIYHFLFFEVKDIQCLSQQGFTYPKLKLGDYCRRTHYLLTVAEKATTLDCIGDKDIKMVDL